MHFTVTAEWLSDTEEVTFYFINPNTVILENIAVDWGVDAGFIYILHNYSFHGEED